MLFKISKLAILLLSLIVSMIPIKSFAYNIEVANEDGIIIYYSWINDKTELAVSQGPYDFSKVESGKLIIPASVSYQGTEYPVTLIEASAFCYCLDLTDVVIPNSVKYIGFAAFYVCLNLTNVTMSDSVTTIDGYAFSNCGSLKNITIPESVTSIGPYAFQCVGLKSVKIYCEEIGSWFSGMTSIEELVLGDKVKHICNRAFYFSYKLNDINIPASVVSIGDSAFADCSNLKKVCIDGNPDIYQEAFANCNRIDSIILRSPTPPKMVYSFTESTYKNAVLSIPKGSYDAYIASDTWSRFKLICTSGDNGYEADFENDSIYYTYKDDGVYVAARRAIGRNNYIGRNNFDGPLTPRDPNTGGLQPRAPIRDVPKKTISDSLDYIPYYGHIVIPESVTVNDTIYKVTGIDDLAFKGCEELESVIIPESVKQIGYAGFAECTNLTQITIPAGVELIDMYAFAYCSGLKRVIIQGNPMIDETAFIGCGADLEIITTVVESHQATDPNSVTDGAVHYGIDGRRIQADAPGLHIIKHKDGTVTKALVR